MHTLYLDEFGHPGLYIPADPKHRHHPLFGFSGVAVPAARWRDLDRGFLRLKRRFYRAEIDREFYLKNVRPEHWEPKQLSSRRDRVFAKELLKLIAECDAHVFAYGLRKHGTRVTHDEVAMYNSTVQGILTQFERYLREVEPTGCGMIIMDRRMEHQNGLVLRSAQSHIFSDDYMRAPGARLVETPLLVPSEYYHGVQVADLVGRVIAAIMRYRLIHDQAYRWAETGLGRSVGDVTYHIGQWKSVFVRP